MKESYKLVALLVACSFLALVALWLFPLNNAANNALTARTVAAKGLAEELARHFPGKHAIVVANPFAQKKGVPAEAYAYQQAGLKGLRQGFGTKIELEAVLYPELRKEAQINPRAVQADPESTTPLSYLVSGNAFDALTHSHPNCDLLISLIGLPLNVIHSEVWKSPVLKLALLLPDWRILGDRESVRLAFNSGKIVAAILNKPGAPSESVPLQKGNAFDERYLLVTPARVDELMAKYPQAF